MSAFYISEEIVRVAMDYKDGKKTLTELCEEIEQYVEMAYKEGKNEDLQ